MEVGNVSERSFHRFLGRLGLAGLGGYVGYEQGYDAGVADVIEEGAATVIYAPGRGPFGGKFYGVGLFFIIMSVFKLFAFGMMGGHRGYAGKGWSGHHPGWDEREHHRWGRKYHHDDGDPEINDDEAKIAKLAKDFLERGGFRVVVASEGDSAVRIARSERPDMVVLDRNLPGMDGLDVCRQIRSFSDVPIIMLTARIEETDRLIGLELGADDYITKPFSPRELVVVVADITRINQVIGNLLVNALRHTERGGTITVADIQDTNRVRLQIQDSGSRITPDDLPFVFDRFWMLATSINGTVSQWRV